MYIDGILVFRLQNWNKKLLFCPLGKYFFRQIKCAEIDEFCLVTYFFCEMIASSTNSRKNCNLHNEKIFRESNSIKKHWNVIYEIFVKKVWKLIPAISTL